MLIPDKNKRPDGLTSSAANLTLCPEIEPLVHIVEIQLKVAQMDMLDILSTKISLITQSYQQPRSLFWLLIHVSDYLPMPLSVCYDY